MKRGAHARKRSSVFRQDGFGRNHAFYLRNPDGIVLEIMQPPDG